MTATRSHRRRYVSWRRTRGVAVLVPVVAFLLWPSPGTVIVWALLLATYNLATAAVDRWRRTGGLRRGEHRADLATGLR